MHLRLAAASCVLVAAACWCGPGTVTTTPDIAVDERSLEFGDVPVLNPKISLLIQQRLPSL